MTDPMDVVCARCGAIPGQPCVNPESQAVLDTTHYWRRQRAAV